MTNEPLKFDVLAKRIECLQQGHCSGEMHGGNCACWWYSHFQIMDRLERWLKYGIAFTTGFLIADLFR